MKRAAALVARGDWAMHVAVGLVSLLLAALALELWRADLTVPFTYSGDALPVAAHFKTAFETWWYESQPLLGAPAGQTYHDFPTSDNTNFLAAALLGHLVGSWSLALNLYFVLGFPLAGIAAAWFLRVAGASKTMTLATAPLFAILSYHFLRGESHLFLASYYVVPLSLVLVLRAARGERLWGWRDTAHPVGRWFGRGLQTTVIVVLTGSTQAYYAVFAVILLAVAGVVALIRDRAWPRFWGAVAVGVGIVVVMGLNMLPDTIYAWTHGANPIGFQRGHADAEIYALKLTQLLLPWSGHRIDLLAQLRSLYDTHYPLLSEQPSLGAVAAVGFVAAVGLVLVRAIAAARGRELSARAATVSTLGGLALVAFLFATVGGVSTLISFLTASIRGWNRMSVIIALLGLAVVALLLDALRERLSARLRPAAARGAVGAIVVGVLVVGYIDQTPADVGAAYASTIEQYRSDEAYFAEVESQLDSGDWVVQLPYLGFPESVSSTGVLGSEVLIPYLHTTRIGWTGGGIKGRPQADWTDGLDDYGPEHVVELARISGASGVLVDHRVVTVSYQPVVEAIAADLGDGLTSPDGRYTFWRLPDEAAQDAAELVTLPVTLHPSGDYLVNTDETGQHQAVADGASLSIDLINARDEPVEVELSLRFDGESAFVDLPDGTRVEAQPGDDGALVAHARVVVPPGVTSLAVQADRDSRLRWLVTDPTLVRVLEGD